VVEVVGESKEVEEVSSSDNEQEVIEVIGFD